MESIRLYEDRDRGARIPEGFELGSGPDRAFALLHPGRQRLRLVRVSPKRICVAADGIDIPDRADLVVCHGAMRVGPFACRVIDRRRQPEHGHLETRVVLGVIESTVSLARQLLRLAQRAGRNHGSRELGVLARQDMHRAEDVRSAIRALILARSTGSIRRPGLGSVPVTAAHFMLGSELPLLFETGDQPPAAPFRVTLHGEVSTYTFTVPDAAMEGRYLATALPLHVVRTRRRTSRRVPCPEPMGVRFRHPAFPEHEVEGEVADLSLTGIALRVDPIEAMLCPELRVDQLVLTRNGHDCMTVSGTVRHVQLGRGVLPTGIALHLSDEQRAMFQQLCEPLLNPRTSRGGAPVERWFGLYRESGFFALGGIRRDAEMVDRAPYEEVTGKLKAAPHLGCRVVWPSSDGVEASLSAIKLYPGTWVGLEMAKRPRTMVGEVPSKQLLRDVHFHVYEHLSCDPDLRWILSYVGPAAGFVRRVHYDFPKRFAGTGKASVHAVRPVTIECRALTSRAVDASLANDGDIRRGARSSLRIAPATEEETHIAREVMATTLSSAYLNAIDMAPRAQVDGARAAEGQRPAGLRSSMSRLADEYERAGMRRHRELLAAHDSDTLVAVAVIDIASDGLDLRGFADTARIVEMRPLGNEHRTALLSAVAERYLAEGKSRFTWLDEAIREKTALPLHDSGAGDTVSDALGLPVGSAIDHGPMDIAVFSSALLPDFLERVWEVTASVQATERDRKTVIA